MKKLLKRKNRASATIEAVIIMPTVFFIILAIFFAFQILYQNVVLEYAASYGATRGALLWDYETSGVDFMAGTVGDKVGPYTNLKQLIGGTGLSERETLIKTQTEKIINSLTVFGGDLNVSVDYSGKFTGRYITVTAEQSVSIPFQSLLEFFSGGDMKISASSTASIYDPDEFIRNADYIYEISSSIIKQVSQKISEIKKNMKSS